MERQLRLRERTGSEAGKEEGRNKTAWRQNEKVGEDSNEDRCKDWELGDC